MKKNSGRRIFLIVLLIFTAGAVLAGCGKKKEEKAAEDTVVAMVGQERIYLKEAIFYARMNQADYEDKYRDTYGESLWGKDILENGMTLEENVKENVIKKILETTVLAAHAPEYNVELTQDDRAQVEEITAAFLAEYGTAVLEEIGENTDYAKKIFEKALLASKVKEAAMGAVELEVSEEEALQKTFSYTWIATSKEAEDGSLVPLAEEEILTLKEKAEELLKALKESQDFEATVNEEHFTAATVTYGPDKTVEGVDPILIETAELLEEGQVSDVIENENGYYIVKLISSRDEEKTEQRKSELLEQKRENFFQQLYEGWVADVDYQVDEEVWSSVTFENNITNGTDSSAGEAEPEAGEETPEGGELPGEPEAGMTEGDSDSGETNQKDTEGTVE